MDLAMKKLFIMLWYNNKRDNLITKMECFYSHYCGVPLIKY